MKAHAVDRWDYYNIDRTRANGPERIKVADNGRLHLKLKRPAVFSYLTVDITILPEESTESGEESPDTQPNS